MRTRSTDKTALAALALLARAPGAQISAEQIEAIVRFIDKAMKKTKLEVSSYEDRLFELLMARFDSMRPFRESFMTLAELCARKPPEALALYKALLPSMRRALVLAAPQKLIPGVLETHLLLGIYHLAFQRWRKDDTPDQGKTMAALDHAIRACAFPR